MAWADPSKLFCLKGWQGCIFLPLTLLSFSPPLPNTLHIPASPFVLVHMWQHGHPDQLCNLAENSCTNHLLHCFSLEPERWVSNAAKAGKKVIQYPCEGRKKEGILMSLSWSWNCVFVYLWILFLWRCLFEGSTLQSPLLNLISRFIRV